MDYKVSCCYSWSSTFYLCSLKPDHLCKFWFFPVSESMPPAGQVCYLSLPTAGLGRELLADQVRHLMPHNPEATALGLPLPLGGTCSGMGWESHFQGCFLSPWLLLRVSKSASPSGPVAWNPVPASLLMHLLPSSPEIIVFSSRKAKT